SQTLHRSIFEVPVYAARLKLSGRFGFPRIADVAADAVTVRWRDAAFVLGLSGVSGLKETAVLKIAGTPEIAFAPSVGFPSTRRPASRPTSGPPGTPLPPPLRRRNRLPSRWTWPLTVQSRSPSRRSPVRRACRSAPTGRTRASPAHSFPTIVE